MGLSDIISSDDKGNAQGIQERQQAFKDISSGALVNKPAAAPTSTNTSTPVVKRNPANQYGTKPGEKRIDTSSMTKPLGSFKKGGKVKKTGMYKLHKGETVKTKKQMGKLASIVAKG